MFEIANIVRIFEEMRQIYQLFLVYLPHLHIYYYLIRNRNAKPPDGMFYGLTTTTSARRSWLSSAKACVGPMPFTETFAAGTPCAIR